MYTGNATDALGQIYEPDTSNIMSYSPDVCTDFLVKNNMHTCMQDIIFTGEHITNAPLSMYHLIMKKVIIVIIV